MIGDFFRAMGIPLLHGQYCADDDTANNQLVVTVNHEFAQHYWPMEIGIRCSMDASPIAESIEPEQQRAYSTPMENAAPAIKVLIIDDHPVVRLGLKTMLESEGQIVVTGAVGSAREGIVEVEKVRPDVVLMDLRMPEMEGVEAISELRRKDQNLRVLVLTNYEEDEYILHAMQAGAMGYLLKNTPQEEIIRAVDMVNQNQRCVSPEVAKRLSEAVAREELTQRELEVLKLVADGLTNKEIAEQLFISAKTARNHVASCLLKLGADDRTEAVTTAVRRGLIRLSR
jgi:DNA-binding NarL/FixJ family response regulator